MSSKNESTVSELQDRVERLEAQVAHLTDTLLSPLKESECNIKQGVSVEQHTGPASGDTSLSTVHVTPRHRATTLSLERAELPRTQDRQRTQQSPSVTSARFLGAVGVLCFILAGGYLIRLAIVEGWITPTMQLLAVVVFGLALIGAGFVVRERDSQYASYLPAGGIVLLYMAAYGGHLYFGLYDQSLANVLINLVSISCLVLFADFRNHFYALVACCGTYLVPFVLGDETWSFIPLCTYVVVWNITFSVLAGFLKSRLLMGLTAYIALLVVGLTSESAHLVATNNNRLPVLIFQALQFLFFSVMIAWYSIRNREPLSRAEAWALFPLLLLFYMSEYEMIRDLNRGLAPWCAVAFAAWIYGVYKAAQRFFGSASLESLPAVACFLALVGAHAVYGHLMPTSLQPWCAIAIVAFFAVYSAKVLPALKERSVVFVLSLVVIIEYVRVFFDSRVTTAPIPGVILNFAFAATMLVAAHEARGLRSRLGSFLNFLGMAQLLIGFSNLSRIVVGEAAAEYAASALWSATALVLLLLAKNRGKRELAGNAMWLFGITAIKVLLFDTSNSGALSRVVALLIIGALFYAGGYVYQRVGSDNADSSLK